MYDGKNQVAGLTAKKNVPVIPCGDMLANQRIWLKFWVEMCHEVQGAYL